MLIYYISQYTVRKQKRHHHQLNATINVEVEDLVKDKREEQIWV